MRARHFELISAAASALIGWAALGYAVLGRTYFTIETGLSSSGDTATTRGTTSMLEMGIAPQLAAILGGAAVAFGLVLAGAYLHAWHGRSAGRWLILVGVLPVLALSLISFALGPMLWLPVALALAAFGFSLAGETASRGSRPAE